LRCCSGVWKINFIIIISHPDTCILQIDETGTVEDHLIPTLVIGRSCQS
jgi:hypothetical protein